MSMVTAVKYLAEFAAEALRPWDPSRELAARMLADLPLMVRLREDDSATADEVTFLVLGRFDKAEVPTRYGQDHLVVEAEPSTYHKQVFHQYRYEVRDSIGGYAHDPLCWCHKDAVQADAAVLVAEAVAVLDEPKAAREFDDAHGCTWRENGEWLTLLDANGKDSGLNKSRAFVEEHYGPLVEVTP